MSRPRQDEPAFGSDSFLDVVCNIVGILVILMVVVAVRASKAPPPNSTNMAQAPASAEPAPAIAAPVDDRPAPLLLQPVFRYAQLQEPEPVPVPTLVMPAAPEPSQAMLRAVRELNERGQVAQAELKTSQLKLQEIERAAAQQQAEVSQSKELLARLESELAQQRSQTQLTSQEYEAQRQRVEQLQAQLDRLKREQSRPVEMLKHQLPPISKVVEGEEIHFRLKGNRVSLLPMEALAAEVKHDMQRRKDILLNRSYFRGSTRSVQGYTMDYILQLEHMTAEDERRLGPGMRKVGVTGWIIQPADDLVEETLSECKQRESRFQQAIRSGGERATITLWVYPDSFQLHRELADALHERGHWIAARPLPEGVPISGSPQGSKSLAQ